MKKGYYLSCYISISDINYVIDEHMRHDQNMALWYYDEDRVNLVHYWEFERYTGLKHQNKPFYSIEQAVGIINELLSECDLSIENLEAIWGTPELEIYSNAEQINSLDNLDKHFSYHSFAHLFSSILSESRFFYNDDILALEVDGGPDGAYDKGLYGEYLYVGAWTSKGKVKELFPVESPALMWLKLKELTGLEEGTLMALGSASKCRLNIAINYEMPVFNYLQASRLNRYIEDLYNNIMKTSYEGEKIVNRDSSFSEWENKISAIVKIVNEISIHMMERNIDNAIRKYDILPKQTYLALSGGFALNCPINSLIMRRFKKELLAPPCVNDSGLSLGIGLLEFYCQLGHVDFRINTAYHGKEIKSEEIDKIKHSEKWGAFINNITRIDYEQAVYDIIENPVIWVNGKAEIGPRALGARSLIGDPRHIAIKDKLNQIKQRQWWRPVAPIILEENVEEWFENAYPTKYMLNTFYIRKGKEKQVPAISHLDNSARVQTLGKQDNEELYSLIKKFYEMTGVPIICNTSLNDKGQPIINDIENIIRFALIKQIKVAYVNGLRIEFNICTENIYTDSSFTYQIDFNVDKQLLLKTQKEYEYAKKELTSAEIRNYVSNPHLYKDLDIKKEVDVKMVKRMQTLQGVWREQKEMFDYF